MSHKTLTVNARLAHAPKHKAELILQKVGLTSPEAIRLFYIQICLHKGLPFKVAIPQQQSNIEKSADVRAWSDFFESPFQLSEDFAMERDNSPVI